MADRAYYHLERMLPELDDLKSKNLFSVSEIKEIARRRREFEFQLERRAKVKEDYLRYIEYELQVEKLRKIRKKAIVRDLHASKRRWQPSLCDRACAMRIMRIYERAVTRFKGDLSLWLQYIRYCRSQGTRRMQKVLTKAIRLHSMVPGLWIYSAAWEFEHNGDIAAARALMQRGIRMCPKSDKLWLEYLRMELIYTEKLKTKLLNHISGKQVINMSQNEDNEDSDDGIMIINDENNIVTNDTLSALTEQEALLEISTIEDVAYKLASTIYENAITAIPTNLEFRKSFMELLQRTSFSKASALQEFVLSSVEKDFPKNADCWDWQARTRFQMTGKIDEAIKVYENALNIAASVHVYEVYARFLKEVSGLDCSTDDMASISLTLLRNERIEIATQLLRLYSRAKEEKVCDSCLEEDHINVLIRLGKIDAAKQLLKELSFNPSKSSARVWKTRILLEMRGETVSESSSLDRITDMCEQCLRLMPISEAKDICALVLEYFGGRSNGNQIIELMMSKIASSSVDQTHATISCYLIDWALYNQDIKHARKVYNMILGFPSANIVLYKHCIKLESRMADMGCKEAALCLQRLFQSAVDRFSQDPELWLEYYSQEMKLGHFDVAGSIYWRAKKALQDPSSFLEAHQQLLHRRE